MALPPILSDTLSGILGAPLDETRAVYGGDINQAARVMADSADYFVKWHPRSPQGMFPAEARGLRELAAPGAIRVPAVIAAADVDGDCPAYLLMEYITSSPGRGGPDTMARFGAALADLHRTTSSAHGFDQDNFIGRLPQPNPRVASWAEFYRDQRIGFQMAVARQLGRLPKRREDLLTRLMDRLPDMLGDDIPPALLHGDLWAGNYLVDTQGRAALIDPAVCYGHREMDLAMSELFGGFSRAFYDAYFAAHPAPGYDDRRALYQLYYILVHLNHFGESYGPRVDALAARYVG